MRPTESACYKFIMQPLSYTGFGVKAQKDIDCTGAFDPLIKYRFPSKLRVNEIKRLSR